MDIFKINIKQSLILKLQEEQLLGSPMHLLHEVKHFLLSKQKLC